MLYLKFSQLFFCFGAFSIETHQKLPYRIPLKLPMINRKGFILQRILYDLHTTTMMI